MLEKIKKISPKKLFFLVAIVYLLSSLVQVSLTAENKVSGIFIGMPRIYTGDEPGYLLSVFSLVNDSDLHMSNNIQNAQNGGCDQGATYAGKKIGLDLALNPLQGFEDYPRRPVGLPVTAAVFLMPFKNTCLLETFSVWLSLLSVVFGLMFFYFLAKRFFPKHAVFFTLALAFATPLWHYSRTFWTEPWTFLLLTASLYFLLAKENHFLSALTVCFATLFNYALFIPLGVFSLKIIWDKKGSSAIAFFVPVVFTVLLAVIFNLRIFGSFLDPRMTGAPAGNFVLGLFSIFFQPNSGILFSFPAFLFFLFAFGVSKNKKQLLFPFFLVISFILFYANVEWVLYGTGGWGFRYIAPFFSPIFLVIGEWFEKQKGATSKNIFLLVIFISFLISAQAAFLAPLLVNNPPWFLIQYLLSNFASRVI